MIPEKFLCPECKGEPWGTVETIPGCAVVAFDEAGEVFYEGDTEMFWDGSTTGTNEAGEIKFQCRSGHEYTVAGVKEIE